MKLKSVKDWLLRIGSVVRRFFEHTYYFEMMVQFNDNGKEVICGKYVKFLGHIQVRAITYSQALKKAQTNANKMYDQYNGYVQLM